MQLFFQVVQLGQLLRQFLQLGFYGGKLSVFIVASAVQLFFQPLLHLGIGGVLFTGRDQRGNAPFQTGVLRNGKSRLPDEGTAFKDLPVDPQQHLAAVLPGHAGNRIPGSGKYGLEISHGCVGSAGGTSDGQLPAAHQAVDPSAHGGT